MSDKLMKKGQSTAALQALESFISQTGLEMLRRSSILKAGTASITGSRGGYQYAKQL